MSLAALAALAGLALVDSTSFGTLVIPLMMLVATHVRTRNVLVFLATIATFYFILGLALLSGARAAFAAVGPLLETRAASWIELVVGVGLVATAVFTRSRTHRRPMLAPDASLRAVVAAALLAGGIEALSMVPYLAAVGIILGADLAVAHQVLVLAGYVLVMILPAVVLLVVRQLRHASIAPRLRQLEAWMTRSTTGASKWVIAILGVLLAADAVVRLL